MNTEQTLCANIQMNTKSALRAKRQRNPVYKANSKIVECQSRTETQAGYANQRSSKNHGMDVRHVKLENQIKYASQYEHENQISVACQMCHVIQRMNTNQVLIVNQDADVGRLKRDVQKEDASQTIYENQE
jgi:hypothetical protein